MTISANNVWLPYCKEDKGAQVRLFCLPYAGGAASVFRSWSAPLLPEIEVCAIELPGRSTRIREKAVSYLLPLAVTACDGILPYLDRPFAFFGHSMGALLGFEMCRYLQQGMGLKPLVFFAAGRNAAYLPETRITHHLSDDELVQQLQELNSNGTAILDHPEFRKLIMPALRADLNVSETYVFSGQPALECPIVVLGGTQDSETTMAGLEAWRTHTKAGFKLMIFAGDHFFFNTNQQSVLQTIADEIISARISPSTAKVTVASDLG